MSFCFYFTICTSCGETWRNNWGDNWVKAQVMCSCPWRTPYFKAAAWR